MSYYKIWEAPEGAVQRDDFKVSVRNPGGAWEPLFVYEAKVDMHNVRAASMCYFDMEGVVEVRVESRKDMVRDVIIRPLSKHIPFKVEGAAITFCLHEPCKLSIEVNGERFSNLHLFANGLEENPPLPDDSNVLFLKPAIHRKEDIYQALSSPNEPGGVEPEVIYFGPGTHYLEETIFRIPSGKTVYIAGGAMVVGSLVCDHVQHVTIRGRGILYLADFHRFSAFRGIRIRFSQHITVEGLVLLDPPHYSIYIGKSEHIRIRNFKSFSTRGWCDGIDMMSSSHVEIDDVFLRTSDDCIAVYGSRWDYYGDARCITVKNSILWADVAHAMNVGGHGDYRRGGDLIEDIQFSNIDILEHHEPQPGYWGAMNINAGDNNTVRNVTFENIRVEDFELGQLVDIRVVWNEKYNPVAGKRIENIHFRNVTYSGKNENKNRIYGFDRERSIEGVTFTNLRINGKLILDAEQDFDINEHAHGIRFLIE
ncbi:glycosyl hydrolase family 28 protein [Paenibacillus sp. 1P07SE]|uniref:glycosyl hydrolase family 28 protein n=1 Tax=Paenibacillus sp. 1P07SE TaxID=3132209 RepID=UPI0039A511C1